jgi:LCP family protein required for cell wall assembly
VHGGSPIGVMLRWRAELVIVGTALVASVSLVGAALFITSHRHPDLLVGAVRQHPSSVVEAATEPEAAGLGAPLAPEEVDGPGGAAGRRAVGQVGGGTGRELIRPDGRAYGSPVPFDSTITIPSDLVWTLLIGTDARRGEDLRRTRADSIHLIGANPRTGQATIIGVPRDSWIEIPGHGTEKVNQATVYGGPDLLASTLSRYLGLPVQWWVLAGFDTFKSVVDAVGGIDIEVTERMDDYGSEAHFAPGYHHMDGAKALAFARDRHDFADGDFTRSGNQGRVALAALSKLRAEVGDEAGLRRWIGFAFTHLDTDNMSVDDALSLLAVARRTDPALTTNLVLPGRAATAGGQSVVLLDAAGVARISDDVRPDAAIGSARPTTTTTSRPGSSTTQPGSTGTTRPWTQPSTTSTIPATTPTTKQVQA